MLAFVAGLGLLQTQPSMAAGWSELRFEEAFREAQHRKLTYLPTFMAERKTDCFIYPDPERTSCLERLQAHADSVLSCPTSRSRWEEGVVHDSLQAKDTFLTNPKAKVPANVQAIFEWLAAIAQDSVSTLPFPIKLSLQAYKSNVKNAHASVGGKIYASSGLWASAEPLSPYEIAAILAHEIAHVIELHGMDLNCIALEWTDSSFSIHQAQDAFQDDFRGTIRFEAWSELSQRLEYRADKGAVKLLRQAGFDPRLMAQALERIRPKTSGGFSSGSHPDFDARLSAARKEAAK
jgi:hypothetical protein